MRRTWPHATKGDALFHSKESVDHAQEEHSGSFSGYQLPSSSATLSKVPTIEVQSICNQRLGRVVLSLVRELPSMAADITAS